MPSYTTSSGFPQTPDKKLQNHRTYTPSNKYTEESNFSDQSRTNERLNPNMSASPRQRELEGPSSQYSNDFLSSKVKSTDKHTYAGVDIQNILRSISAVELAPISSESSSHSQSLSDASTLLKSSFSHSFFPVLVSQLSLTRQALLSEKLRVAQLGEKLLVSEHEKATLRSTIEQNGAIIDQLLYENAQLLVRQEYSVVQPLDAIVTDELLENTQSLFNDIPTSKSATVLRTKFQSLALELGAVKQHFTLFEKNVEKRLKDSSQRELSAAAKASFLQENLDEKDNEMHKVLETEREKFRAKEEKLKLRLKRLQQKSSTLTDKVADLTDKLISLKNTNYSPNILSPGLGLASNEHPQHNSFYPLNTQESRGGKGTQNNHQASDFEGSHNYEILRQQQENREKWESEIARLTSFQSDSDESGDSDDLRDDFDDSSSPYSYDRDMDSETSHFETSRGLTSLSPTITSPSKQGQNSMRRISSRGSLATRKMKVGNWKNKTTAIQALASEIRELRDIVQDLSLSNETLAEKAFTYKQQLDNVLLKITSFSLRRILPFAAPVPSILEVIKNTATGEINLRVRLIGAKNNDETSSGNTMSAPEKEFLCALTNAHLYFEDEPTSDQLMSRSNGSSFSSGSKRVICLFDSPDNGEKQLQFTFDAESEAKSVEMVQFILDLKANHVNRSTISR